MINLLRPHKLALPDATALVQQMQTGVRSAEAIVTAHLDRLQALHPMLNAATQVWRQRALDEARQPRPGPLSGLPCSVKETFGLAGETVTAGSLLMAPEWHAEDAVVVQKLRDAGAIIIARSNVPEFAMAGESTNLRYGRTNNPLDPRRVAGGSSGGEGALVGSGSSVFGVGSDILGSIRIPSAFCGIVGFKPASEAVDKTGTWPVITGFTDSWLAIGPLARSVRDIRLIYDVIAQQPLPVAGSVRGLRVLAPEQFPFRVQQPCIRQALVAAEQALLTAGMTREAPAFPAVRRLTFDAPLLILHELEADWYRLLSPPGRPAFNIWAETWRQVTGRARIDRGLYTWMIHSATVAQVVKPRTARQVARMLQRFRAARAHYHRLLGDDGVLLLPTMGMVAPVHGAMNRQTLRPGVNPCMTALSFCNYANLPAITVPAWRHVDPSTGLPPAVMLACAPGAEGRLLDGAAVVEAALS